MNVYFGLIKDNKYVLHQSSDRKLWEEFISGSSNNIPEVVVADANDFFKHFNGGLIVENCSECHFWDFQKGIEKVCYNLSNEDLQWEIKEIK